jgi:hypothetical protein
MWSVVPTAPRFRSCTGLALGPNWTTSAQCTMNRSAIKMLLQTVGKVQTAAPRSCLGTFETLPIASLNAEANEPPLRLRRLKFLVVYAVKLKNITCNPAYGCVFEPSFEIHFATRG